MKTAIVTLKSVSPYSQSRMHDTPKLEKEGADEYEKRTWIEKCHALEDGTVYIPPMAFKMCLDAAAKFLGRQIPGKGKSTYTKHFEAGVLVTDPIKLPYKKSELQGEWINANADGVRGSGKRVRRCFPVIKEWQADVPFLVLDETITERVFREHIEEAGKFIGIGRFRPRQGGFYGRFEVVGMKWV